MLGLIKLYYVTYELKAPLFHVHASGHAPIHRVADFINVVKPKKLYVVHSAVPEALKPLVSKNIDVIIQGQT